MLYKLMPLAFNSVLTIDRLQAFFTTRDTVGLGLSIQSSLAIINIKINTCRCSPSKNAVQTAYLTLVMQLSSMYNFIKLSFSEFLGLEILNPIGKLFG